MDRPTDRWKKVDKKKYIKKDLTGRPRAICGQRCPALHDCDME